MWTVDTVDWQKPTPDVLINRVMSKDCIMDQLSLCILQNQLQNH